jgi:hypothetical protein
MQTPGKLSVLSGALLETMFYNSIARAKIAVFHTFHENKEKIIPTKAPMFKRNVSEE